MQSLSQPHTATARFQKLPFANADLSLLEDLLDPLFTQSLRQPRRILLADDDEDLRGLTRAFLRTERYDVISCADGRSALAVAAQRNDIDLLLTDFQMPHVDGLELARLCTAVQPTLPVIVMSGSILTNEQMRTIRRQRWQFLAKPFPVPELLALVASTLGTNGPPGRLPNR